MASDKGKRIRFNDHRDAPKGFNIRETACSKGTFVFRYLSDDGRYWLVSTEELPDDIVEHLWEAYGDRAQAMLEQGLTDRLVASLPYIQADLG